MTLEAQRGDERGDSLDAAAAPPGLNGFDFGLPDFLDLAGAQTDADFGVANTTTDADGGILVFPGAVLVVCGHSNDRLPVETITGWAISDEAATFVVTLTTLDASYPARLLNAFRAPTVSALEGLLGPAEHTA